MSLTALASVEAIVITDKAVIWADQQRSAPLGYVTKGKTVTVGEVPRNKNQVVPIVVSGRVGYIAIEDLSFESGVEEGPQERRYERFKEVARKREGQQVSFGVTGFNAQESKDTAAGRRGDSWNFLGTALKGVAPTPANRLGVMFIVEYLYAENKPETFRAFDLALGLSYALIDGRNIKLKVEAGPVFIPYVQYESSPLFTLNGYGYGALGQGVLDIFFNENWGIEGSLGIQALQFSGIDRPSPFKDFNPLFTGTRWMAGLVYRL